MNELKGLRQYKKYYVVNDGVPKQRYCDGCGQRLK